MPKAGLRGSDLCGDVSGAAVQVCEVLEGAAADFKPLPEEGDEVGSS